MRYSFKIFLFFFLAISFSLLAVDFFAIGENYQFKIKYGFLTVGEAKVEVDPKIYIVNDKKCFKISVVGRTAGMTSLFKVKNSYISYIDTAAFLPQKFIYSARENSYTRDQTILFDQSINEAVLVEKNQKKSFKVPKSTLDVVSGYYFLRTLDFSRFNIGNTFSAPLFFDEEMYNMKVKYAGKGSVNTRYGKINVLKLNPILPSNKMFKGENAIRIWVSDDKNRVPVKIEVDFPFGTIDMDLKNYNNVKYPFSWK